MSNDAPTAHPPVDTNPGCLGYLIAAGAMMLGAAFIVGVPLFGLILYSERDESVTLMDFLASGAGGAITALFLGVALCSYGWTLFRRSRAEPGEEVDAFSGLAGRVNAICGLVFSGCGILMLFGLVIFTLFDDAVPVATGVYQFVFFVPLLAWLGSICLEGLRRNLGREHHP